MNDNKKLHSYSIMQLDTEHLDEICEDIKSQYENGIASCALFCMTLVPEGNPPINKAKIMCGQYALFREKLSAMGIPSGVLVQASIGHGWTLSEMFPFQRYTNFTDGAQPNVVCPMDEGFKRYMYDAMREIALHSPDCIMVDDDFRLLGRNGNGCGCPLHMKRFNSIHGGKELTREELHSLVYASPEVSDRKKLCNDFVEAQKQSLVEAARIMRDGIDSVDPLLPGLFCCVGNNAEFAAEIAKELAGKGNPVTVRINNGNYTAAGARYLSGAFFRAAAQIAKLKGKVDVILAETDTCPQNRYSTGAMQLHSHFTGTILEGANGAKHWITRLRAFEPESGKAYRKVLGKYYGFYEALAALAPTLKWRGCRIPVSKTAEYAFKPEMSSSKDVISAWCDCVLERLGLPVYFSSENGGVLCLEGDADERLTDGEIFEALKKPLFIASNTAKNLIKRGFGDYLGVDVRKWEGKAPSSEQLYVNGNLINLQMQLCELVPKNDGVTVDSEVIHTVDRVNLEKLFPGTTIYKNSLGGIAFVFSGTPEAKFNITEAFSFLNYSRKEQLIGMLSRTEELPVYYPGDAEMYLKAADVPDGSLFCALFNIGLDPIERLEIVCKRTPSKIEKLMPDGTRQKLSFSLSDGRCVLDTPCNTLEPVILFIK